MRNAGKSSLMNAIAGQDIAVVSEVKGTTTDLVNKAMELLPAGPVLLTDTPGFDDDGVLGDKRVEKMRQALRQTDAAVLVVDASLGKSALDLEMEELFSKNDVRYIVAYNKCDLLGACPQPADGEIYVSAARGENIFALKEMLASLLSEEDEEPRLVGDLLSPSDFVVLVTPIDSAAPKGRLILPQQQVVRDILESDAIAVVVKEFQLKDALSGLGGKPRMVITDSQAFAKVSADTPADVPLTSFSILMARYKGLLDSAIEGVRALDRIEDGGSILIAEGCTHHRQCDDIGTVKLPRWIRQYTGKEPNFSFTSGGGFPDDLSPYKLVLHCGGCMLNRREMKYRERTALAQGIPITNYGVLIAQAHGILERSLSVFPHLLKK